MKVLEAECSARMQGWLKTKKSIDVKYHINRTRNMTHMIISMGIENISDKKPNILSGQHSTTGNRRDCLNLRN